MLPQWAHSMLGKTLALTLLSVLACIEKLSAVLNTVSVERDWTVVISGTDEARLATMNAQMRRIDLFCKLAGPLAISLVDSGSSRAAILATAAMSITSVFIEYLAIARVYHAVPALRVPKSPAKYLLQQRHNTLLSKLRSSVSMLLSYIRHPAFLPSFALALLYLTVLSFSGQFITYLLAQGMSSTTVATLRGVAAVFELSATWLGPWLHTRIGPVRAGIWFLNAELVFIALSCVALWLPAETVPGTATTFLLVVAVILSRTGLWGFDLSAQFIIQDEVESEMRGTFSSLEASFQNGFEMLAFLSTVVFPRPEQFKFPAAISAVAVAAAAVLYACFVRDRRGHLLHASKCMDRHQRAKQRQRGFPMGSLQEA
jgi:iron-regulated transporter 1